MRFVVFEEKYPSDFLKRMEKSEFLKKQFVKTEHEKEIWGYESEDPIGDEVKSPVPYLVHRYPFRVLILSSFDCMAHCRFCFRRNRVGQKKEPSQEEWRAIFLYLKRHQEIKEVILSGGDPFTLSFEKWEFVLNELFKIPHLKSLRIHTRVLTLNPQKIDERWLSLFQKYPLQLRLVAHVNHADEISLDFKDKVLLLQKYSFLVYSQSVLLKGINDSLDSLSNLFESLCDLNIQPYYLHCLDSAVGIEHFRVPLKEAQDLLLSLRKILPGYAIPQFILDLPSGYGKVSLGSFYEKKDGDYIFQSPLTLEEIEVSYL